LGPRQKQTNTMTEWKHVLGQWDGTTAAFDTFAAALKKPWPDGAAPWEMKEGSASLAMQCIQHASADDASADHLVRAFLQLHNANRWDVETWKKQLLDQGFVQQVAKMTPTLGLPLLCRALQDGAAPLSRLLQEREAFVTSFASLAGKDHFEVSVVCGMILLLVGRYHGKEEGALQLLQDLSPTVTEVVAVSLVTITQPTAHTDLIVTVVECLCALLKDLPKLDVMQWSWPTLEAANAAPYKNTMTLQPFQRVLVALATAIGYDTVWHLASMFAIKLPGSEDVVSASILLPWLLASDQWPTEIG
jgi:hypothetical protein